MYIIYIYIYLYYFFCPYIHSQIRTNDNNWQKHHVFYTQLWRRWWCGKTWYLVVIWSESSHPGIKVWRLYCCSCWKLSRRWCAWYVFAHASKVSISLKMRILFFLRGWRRSLLVELVLFQRHNEVPRVLTNPRASWQSHCEASRQRQKSYRITARSCDITSYSAAGKLGSDEFATASLKNYPEDLCTAMTKVLQACLLRYAPKSNSGDDLALDEFTVTPLCKIWCVLWSKLPLFPYNRGWSSTQ